MLHNTMFNIDRNTTNASEPNNNHWCSEPNALMLIFHHYILTSMNRKVQIPIYVALPQQEIKPNLASIGSSFSFRKVFKVQPKIILISLHHIKVSVNPSQISSQLTVIN
jgi:hypothetical protein